MPVTDRARASRLTARPEERAQRSSVSGVQSQMLDVAHVVRSLPVNWGSRFSLKAASASGMSDPRVSSACPRFSSSSAAA